MRPPAFVPFAADELERSVQERFAAIARRYDSRLAVSDLTGALTYGELASLVDRIASAVEAASDARPGPVAILLPPDRRFPAALLGVLVARGFYLPLDPDHPPARNRAVVEHAGTVAVVTAGALVDVAGSLLGRGDEVVVDLDRLPDASGRRIRRGSPDDLAQLVYTSGSSGAPKGVHQNHRALLHAVMHRINDARLGCEDRVALTYPATASAGPPHILAALLSGASLHVLPPQKLGPAALAREMLDRRITVHHSVPSLFRRIAESLGDDETFAAMRVVRFGGERAEWRDVHVFRRACPPEARLIVCISSAEGASIVAQWDVDPAIRDTSPWPPVGRVVENFAVAIVGDDGHPVAEGEVGEIVVSSRYLALGYWNDAELTRRYFGVDPTDPQRRTFRSGDLGRLRADGLIEFHGRKDERIKLRGQRVELGEVEAALRGCCGVRDAAIVVRRDARGEPRALVGYAEVAPPSEGMLPRHLLAMLAKQLPRYMVPSAIVPVGALPRLSNQKLDRIRLAELDAELQAQASRRTDGVVLAEVVALFERTLVVGGATPDDNLWTLGGDSFQAIAMALALENRFGVEVPPERFAGFQTIRDLAEWIGAQAVSPNHG